MADRRTAQQKTQYGHPTEGVGAPGSTGAFKTSDPLGAPGSTGAGMTHHDPTAIPGVGAPGTIVYEEFDYETGGGDQQQQHRTQHQDPQHRGFSPTDLGHGNTGHQKVHDPTSGVGGLRNPNPTPGVGGFGGDHLNPNATTGVGGLADRSKQQTHHLNPNPSSGVGGFGGDHLNPNMTTGVGGLADKSKQQAHHLNPQLGHHVSPTGVCYGGTGQQQEHRGPISDFGGLGGVGQQQSHHHVNPTSGVGYGGTREHHEVRDPTGVTRVTTAAAPTDGGGVVYGREMKTTRADDLGEGREEKKAGIAEKAKEIKDKIKGAACGGGHSP